MAILPPTRNERGFVVVVAALSAIAAWACHRGEFLYGQSSDGGDAAHPSEGDAKTADPPAVEPPTECVMGATHYPAGAANPDGVCEICNPSVLPTGWSRSPDGTSCGAGEVCYGGACEAGCLLGAAYYASGVTNPFNPCQRCEPMVSSFGWTRASTPCVEAIAAGSQYACAVVNGAAWCWGLGTDGQLGNNSNALITVVPVQVEGLTSGVQAISAGETHVCAVVDGGARCWGRNERGQLGDNSRTTSPVPVQVQGLEQGVQSIAAGMDHSCAVVHGGVQCWGSNMNGMLGNDYSTLSSGPRLVRGLTSGAQSVSAGRDFSCALALGGIQCWGWGGIGQLGNKSSTRSATPVPVEGLDSGVQAIASQSFHSCAVVSGGAQCWGSNSSGQLGNDTNTKSAIPVRVQGLDSGVQAIAIGSNHSCAVVHGGARCWGENGSGQLGNGSYGSGYVPVPVEGLESGVQAIAGGWGHTCALANGSVYCWGSNTYGQLGDGTAANRPVVGAPIKFQQAP